MRLNEADILKLLPEFMRKDEANIALSAAINAIAADAYSKIRVFSIWNMIDYLGDATLDALAYDLNISWYRSTADIEVKRAVIKASDLVHAKLGTPWAVDKMMSDYYGEVKVREWWVYGGTPGHFKLFTTSTEITNSRQLRKDALALLEICKRKSSKLDDIAVTLTGDQQLYMGTAVHDCTCVTVLFGNIGKIVAEAQRMIAQKLYLGAAVHDYTYETVSLGNIDEIVAEAERRNNEQIR